MLDKILFSLRKKYFGKSNYFVQINGVLYPQLEFILEVHNFLIKSYAKSSDAIHGGVRDYATLYFMLYKVKYDIGYSSNVRHDILIRACHIFNYIVTGHCFVDGNKRTGFVVSILFLRLNNIDMDGGSSDYLQNFDFIVKIAKRKTNDSRNIHEIYLWMEQLIR